MIIGVPKKIKRDEYVSVCCPWAAIHDRIESTQAN